MKAAECLEEKVVRHLALLGHADLYVAANLLKDFLGVDEADAPPSSKPQIGRVQQLRGFEGRRTGHLALNADLENRHGGPQPINKVA